MMRRFPVLVGYAQSPLLRAQAPFRAPGSLTREALMRAGAVHGPRPSERLGYRITFVLDFRSGTDRSHADLQDMLECLTRIDERYLRENPYTPRLYESGVRYEEEPLGEEDWNDIPTMLKKRRYLDCEDIACWRTAELRVRDGIRATPFFTQQVKPDGGYLYHILVRYPDGRVEDPSRVLGMR